MSTTSQPYVRSSRTSRIRTYYWTNRAENHFTRKLTAKSPAMYYLKPPLKVLRAVF